MWFLSVWRLQHSFRFLHKDLILTGGKGRDETVDIMSSLNSGFVSYCPGDGADLVSGVMALGSCPLTFSSVFNTGNQDKSISCVKLVLVWACSKPHETIKASCKVSCFITYTQTNTLICMHVTWFSGEGTDWSTVTWRTNNGKNRLFFSLFCPYLLCL